MSSKDYWQLVLLLCRVWCLKAIRFLQLDGCSKWKSDENGNVTKAKDRLVARGCGQDIDPSDTFSPTPSASTVHLLVALACEYEWDLNHFDVEQAFVQSKLDSEVASTPWLVRWRVR